MVRYLCEITTHRGRCLSTQLHHFVFTEQRNKQEPEMLHNQKNVFHSNVAVWFFTICSAYGIRTRDLHSDSVAF